MKIKIMYTLLVIIIVLAILVLSHEVGHFVAARKSKVGVYEFGFGFPPRIFGVQIRRGARLVKVAEMEKVGVTEEAGMPVVTDQIREIDVLKKEKQWRFVWGNRELTPDDEQYGTVYSLNWIPLGGFVKIKGESGESTDPDSFVMQKTWKKAVILVSGVLMNVLLAAVLLSIGYGIGLPTVTDQIEDASVVRDRQLVIMQVVPGKPAEAAGLEAQDVIAKIGTVENPRLKEMQEYVDAHKTEWIEVVIKRDDQTITQQIQPAIIEETGKGGIGVGIAELGTVKYPWYKAIYRGFVDTAMYLKEIVVAFYVLIAGLVTGKGVAEAVTGPVGIAVMAGQVAKMGIMYLIQFTAILSLNLAVLNILPLPALDGGRLLFLALNKIKKINFAKYEQAVHSIGFALLLLLVIVVTVRDIGTFKDLFIGFFNRMF